MQQISLSSHQQACYYLPTLIVHGTPNAWGATETMLVRSSMLITYQGASGVSSDCLTFNLELEEPASIKNDTHVHVAQGVFTEI